LQESGILCNRWRNVGKITPKEIEQRLTERNLLWHFSHHDDPDPDEGNEEFGSHTPFDFTIAGATERDATGSRSLLDPPFMTALQPSEDRSCA
jgi:hypothetical protein